MIITKSAKLEALFSKLKEENLSAIEMIEVLKRKKAASFFNSYSSRRRWIDQDTFTRILDDQKTDSISCGKKPGLRIWRQPIGHANRPYVYMDFFPSNAGNLRSIDINDLQYGRVFYQDKDAKHLADYFFATFLAAWQKLRTAKIAEIRANLSEDDLNGWVHEREASRTGAIVEMSLAAGKLRDELESYQKQIMNVTTLDAADSLFSRIESSVSNLTYLRNKLRPKLKAAFKIPAKKSVDRAMAAKAKAEAKAAKIEAAEAERAERVLARKAGSPK